MVHQQHKNAIQNIVKLFYVNKLPNLDIITNYSLNKILQLHRYTNQNNIGDKGRSVLSDSKGFWPTKKIIMSLAILSRRSTRIFLKNFKDISADIRWLTRSQPLHIYTAKMASVSKLLISHFYSYYYVLIIIVACCF